MRTLRLVVAWIRYRIGEVIGDYQLLEGATANLIEVVNSIEKDRSPLEWAEAQNSLGIVLSRLGEHKSDRETLDLAIGAFCSSQEKYTRQDADLEWAAAQHKLG